MTAEFHCGGQHHRIVWRRGKLVLEDHDLLAERSLIALGSEPPLCVEVLDAWRRMRGPELLQDLGGGTVTRDELAMRTIRHAQSAKPTPSSTRRRRSTASLSRWDPSTHASQIIR